MPATCPLEHSSTEFELNKIIPVSAHLKKASYGTNKFLFFLSFISPFHLVGLGLFVSLLMPTMVTLALSSLLLLYPLTKQILRHYNYLPTPYSTDIIRTTFTARFDGDFVVFLIGVRPNGANPFTKYTDEIGKAFESMVKELENDDTLGYMGGDNYVGANSRKSAAMMVQYWRSYESLQKWTHTRMGIHMKTVEEYIKKDRVAGTTGIWHETYKVRDGEYEAVYANMPPIGLALATNVTPELKTNNGPGRMARRRKEKEEAAQMIQTN